MNCDEARRHWNLYYDSEGDRELYFQINEHLAECAECAEWFHKESRLEDLLVEKLSPAPATPELWEAVLSQTGVMPAKSTRRWLFFGSVLALAASLLIAVGLWRHFGPSGSPDLVKLSATYHDELSDGKLGVEFESQSDLEVEAYLRQRVNFPVRCPPREDAGFLVEGAGICRMADRPAAYLVGHVDGQSVSIFILPRESLARFPRQRDELKQKGAHICHEGRFEMALGEIDQNVVLVVGRTNGGHLLRVLNAYGTYPEPHHG